METTSVWVKPRKEQWTFAGVQGATPMSIHGRDIVPGSSSEQNVGLDRLSTEVLNCLEVRGSEFHKPMTKLCLQPSS